VAWRALAELPAREPIEAASADAARGGEGRRRPSGETPLQPEPERRVRHIDEDGVVSVRPDGRLLRAPTPEPPATDAPEPEPEPDLYNLVVIESAELIDARTRRFRLAHVDAPEVDASCAAQDGQAWPCGRRARTALRRLVQRRAIACDALEPGAAPHEDEPTVAECTVGGTNLSRWLIENGWAEPTATAPAAWAALHETARSKGRGLFDRDPR
jgi:endonuclease YncB( thermonuclease family)